MFETNLDPVITIHNPQLHCKDKKKNEISIDSFKN